MTEAKVGDEYLLYIEEKNNNNKFCFSDSRHFSYCQ